MKSQVSNAVLLVGKVDSDGLYEFPLLDVSKSTKSLVPTNKIVPSIHALLVFLLLYPMYDI